VILKSQLLQDIAEKQNSGFPFKNKQKNNQPTKTMKWDSQGPEFF